MPFDHRKLSYAVLFYDYFKRKGIKHDDFKRYRTFSEKFLSTEVPYIPGFFVAACVVKETVLHDSKAVLFLLLTV